MSRALQVYYPAFNEVFLRLPDNVRQRIEAGVDDMGLRLSSYPHYRMSGGHRYRLRVGDYRVIYTFDLVRNEIHLLAVAIVVRFIGEANSSALKTLSSRRARSQASGFPN